MKKTASVLLCILLLIFLTACAAASSPEPVQTPGINLPETTSPIHNEEEPSPQTLPPRAPGISPEQFLEEFNSTLSQWGLPYTLERDPDFYGRSKAKHYFVLRRENGELMPDNTEYYFDAGSAYPDFDTIYSVTFTLFEQASEELRSLFPQLCAALSVTMDPEMETDQAASIFHMEPTYQSDSSAQYRLDTSHCAHTLSVSAVSGSSEPARLSYSFFDFDYWDLIYRANRFEPLNAEALGYDFGVEPCPDGSMVFRFGDTGLMNCYSPYIQDLSLGFLLENVPPEPDGILRYTLRDTTGNRFVYLSQNSFVISLFHLGNEAGERYIRIHWDTGNLTREPLEGTNSALLENPEHLLRPVLGLMQLCDPGLTAAEAMDFLQGEGDTALQMDNGTAYSLLAPNSTAFILKQSSASDEREITIVTKTCFETLFGTLDRFLENQYALNDFSLEGFAD